MKVNFCCNNQANIHSKYVETFDVEKDLLLTVEEWTKMSEENKYEMVKEWAFQRFDYWFEEEE